LPYFKKSENHECGENIYRGGNGFLTVGKYKTPNVLHNAWLEAGKQASYGHTEDFNGYKQVRIKFLDYQVLLIIQFQFLIYYINSYNIIG